MLTQEELPSEQKAKPPYRLLSMEQLRHSRPTDAEATGFTSSAVNMARRVFAG